MLEASTTKGILLEDTREVRCDEEGRLEVVLTSQLGKEKTINININLSNIFSGLANCLLLVFLILLLLRFPDFVEVISKIHSFNTLCRYL